jgi:hypothetical protein
MRSERRRIEDVAAWAFASHAQRFDALGQGILAVRAAERLVALDPLREDWQRLALRLHARYRGAEWALARARSLADLVHREVDVPLEGATLALVDDIRQGRIALTAPQTTTPPAEPSDSGAGRPPAGGAERREVASQETEPEPAASGAATTVAGEHRASFAAVYRQWLWRIAWSVGIIAVTTVLLYAIEDVAAPPHLIFAYMLPMLFIAGRYGNIAAAIASLASDLGATYALYAPKLSLYIASSDDIRELALYTLLVLAATQLVGRWAAARALKR